MFTGIRVVPEVNFPVPLARRYDAPTRAQKDARDRKAPLVADETTLAKRLKHKVTCMSFRPVSFTMTQRTEPFNGGLLAVVGMVAVQLFLLHQLSTPLASVWFFHSTSRNGLLNLTLSLVARDLGFDFPWAGESTYTYGHDRSSLSMT